MSFYVSRSNTENETFLFHNIPMENSKERKILRVTIDNKLNFKSHNSANVL